MAHGGAVSFPSIAMIAALGRRRTRVQGLRHSAVASTVRGACPSRRLRMTADERGRRYSLTCCARR
ncbi:unnamed protein product [Ectocarpus sp. 12 AP-2014]